MSSQQIINHHFNIGFAEELKEIEDIDINFSFLPNCDPLPFKVQNNKIFLENIETSTKDNLGLGRAEQVIVDYKWEKYEKERDELITGEKRRKRQRRIIERPNPRIDVEIDIEEDLMTILERDELLIQERHIILDEEPLLINGRLRPIDPPEIPFNPVGDFGDDVNIPEIEPALINGTLVPVVPSHEDFGDIIIPETPERILNVPARELSLNSHQCKFKLINFICF